MKLSYKRHKDGSISIHFDNISQGKAFTLIHALIDLQTTLSKEMLLALHRKIQESNVPEWKNDDQSLFNESDVVQESQP